MGSWYLEGYFESDDCMKQLPIRNFPQVLGRDDSLICSFPSNSVSRRHASLELEGDHLCISDLGSRNGTFVNRHRISEPTSINHGDVIHLGGVEFRLMDSHHDTAANTVVDDVPESTMLAHVALSERFPFGVIELEQLIGKSAVNMHYQPIVSADGTSLFGYEVLGRGASDDLPSSPLGLFRIAESVGLEVTLSELMRNCGVKLAARYNLPGILLINTHPKELDDPEHLMSSLAKLRESCPNQKLMLEIHEQSVTDVSVLQHLKRDLMQYDIGIAFDDFGVGQSRLMDMVETKPDLIKFDKEMIFNIHEADESRLMLLRSMKELVNKLQIKSLAECVSHQGEYDICNDLGFDLYQGYLFGKPQSVQQLLQ